MSKVIMMKKDVYENAFNQEIKELSKYSKQYLKEEVERNCRVIDTKGLTKNDLISKMLEIKGWFNMIRIA